MESERLICPFKMEGCVGDKCAWATQDEDGIFLMCAVRLIALSLNDNGGFSFSPRDEDP